MAVRVYQNETRLEEFRIRNKIEAIIVHRKPAENNRGPLYTRETSMGVPGGGGG